MIYKIRNEEHMEYINYDFIQKETTLPSVHCDIDRCIQRNGHFLIFEMKVDNVSINDNIYKGQKMTLDYLHKLGMAVVVVYHSKPIDHMINVTGISYWPFDKTDICDNEGLANMVNVWLSLQ